MGCWFCIGSVMWPPLLDLVAHRCDTFVGSSHGDALATYPLAELHTRASHHHHVAFCRPVVQPHVAALFHSGLCCRVHDHVRARALANHW